MSNESYRNLFEIANKNMQQSGKTLYHRRAAFFYYVNNDPYAIDILKLFETNASNEEFIDIACIAFLNHPADDSLLKYYENILFLPRSEFRIKVILDLKNSDESKNVGKKIINFIDESKNVSENKISQKIMLWSLSIYRKIPNRLKRYIKKVLGVGKE